MSYDDYKYSRPGIGNVGSYQVAGMPFVTGTTILSSSFSVNNGEVQIDYPYVAKSTTVINRSNTDIRIHFNTISGTNVIDGHHYITLKNDNDSVTIDCKSKQIFISLATSSADAEFELFAELTHIPTSSMYTLTGSGLTD